MMVRKVVVTLCITLLIGAYSASAALEPIPVGPILPMTPEAHGSATGDQG